MLQQVSQSVEDYLKVIYEITTVQERASTKEIAEWLKVRPASVTGMLQKLASATPPLVDYHKHHGARLTTLGEQIALETIRSHRLVETFLYDQLGYPWDQVHAEAERLEHAISAELIERIDQSLGYPSFDPHGDPIPNGSLHVPLLASQPLSQSIPGQQVTVLRVASNNPELLRFLGGLGIQPGVQITVQTRTPLDGNLHLAVAGQPGTLVLGSQVTSQVYVTLPG